jgi:hypothetical protein
MVLHGSEQRFASPIILHPGRRSRATGVSRTRIFMAIRDEELTARKAGKSTVIEADELRRWLRSLPTKGREPHTATA